MSGEKGAPRILLVGDALGRLNALFKRIQTVNKNNGPFDAVLCVGQFFPNEASGVEEMEAYFTGEKPIPLPTYFIGDYGEGATALLAPARLKAAEAGIFMDGVTVCDNLIWLKSSGILNLKGLRVAYLSGKHNPELYRTAREPQLLEPTLRMTSMPSAHFQMKKENEWPQGVLTGADLAAVPESIDRATGSTIAAELASELKPRYHFAGSEGVFYAREPYIQPEVAHITRFIGLGAVGNDKKQKFIHALSPTPASVMLPIDLAARPANTTLSPYELALQKGLKDSTTGIVQKRDIGQTGKVSADDGQYWRYDVSQGKRQRRDDGGERVCFEFVKQGSCSRGESCRFKHDLGNGTPIPKGVCFDFVTKGKCERGADCRYRHSLEEDASQVDGGELPPGVCFDFFRKGQCERGSECRFSHSLDDPRPTRTPRPPPDACWFCLSSPSIETHLVVSVGDHCYCAIAKGPLCPGHLLVLPIEHQPSTISLPPDAVLEMEKYKQAIRECFKSQGKATIFFERYLQLRAGTHAHLQAVPIPLAQASIARSTFVSSAKEVGFDFEQILPGNTDIEVRQALKDLVGGGVNYFYVELPEGTLLAHALAPGEKLPMQFGREVLASILGTPERGTGKHAS